MVLGVQVFLIYNIEKYDMPLPILSLDWLYCVAINFISMEKCYLMLLLEFSNILLYILQYIYILYYPLEKDMNL